jgi:hypothetical protein
MQELTTLRALFRADLDAETRKNAWGPEERMLWAMEHLDEYIERWLGFAAHIVSPQALIGSDLFTVIEIAVEALEQEFARSRIDLESRRPERFRVALELLRRTGDRKYADLMKHLVEEFRSSSLGDLD